MALYFGSSEVGRIWSGCDAYKVMRRTSSVWRSPAISDWAYISDHSTAALLLYRGSSSFLTAPSRIGGCPVTAMAASACNYTGARLAVIPETLMVIG